MLKFILNIILFFLVIIIQLTIFPIDKIFLNLPLCLIIYFAFHNFSLALFYVILAGLFFDLFSIFNFPIFTLSFLSSFLVVDFIIRKFLSLKGFLPFIILSLIGFFIYQLTFLLINYLTYFLRKEEIFIIFNRNYFFNLFSFLFVNLVFICLFFLFLKEEKHGKFV